MFKHTIVITGITLLSAFGTVASTPANPPDLTLGVTNLSLTNGAIEMIVIGLAGLIWLCRRRVFKALGRD